MTERNAQYDDIGLFYEEYARKAALKRAEAYTLFKNLGDIEGKQILDVACGFGLYTRALLERGAAKVIGVDVSKEMIQLAESRERANPVGATYLVCDCAALPALGAFDLISAVYLFNYATSKAHMRDMFVGMQQNMKLGGRLVAYTVNPDFDMNKSSFTKYGITVFSEARIEGGFLAKGVFVTEPPTPIEAYRWDSDVYEWAAREAGLKNFKWHALEVPVGDFAERGPDFWRDFQDNCIAVGFSCAR